MGTPMFRDNTKKILEYLQANDGVDLTLETLAQGVGLPEKSVNGSLISLQREISGHGKLVERVEVEGFEKKVIRLTAEGKAIDSNAQKPEKKSE